MDQSKRSLLVAISAGGLNEELAAQGIGMDHVDELTVRLARNLLRNGHRIAFGGTLADPTQRLTTQLIDTAHQWFDQNTANNVDVTKPNTWPMRNYSAWDFYKWISSEDVNKLVGICNFVRVDPPGVAQAELDGELIPGRVNRLRSDALTEMRRVSSKEADLRVVFAGRIRGAKGWMAGILEEVVCSLELNKPVIVVGGFGGCSRLIADYLTSFADSEDATNVWPPQLDLDASADDARDATLTVQERDDLNKRMGHARSVLNNYQQSMQDADPINGTTGILASGQLWVIPSSNENARQIVGAVSEIANQLAKISG